MSGPQQAALSDPALPGCWGDPDPHPRSRALGYLLGIALKAMEVGEIEQRLGTLEERLAGFLGSKTG